MSVQSNPPVYTQPLVYPPAQAHKSTLIILHGRGSTAQKFAEPLLNHAVSCSESESTTSPDSSKTTPRSFKSHFPNTKFIFPTAPRRRAVVFNRSLTHQWFDTWSLVEPELKQHLQVAGLRETSLYLHNLLREEMDAVGPGNVVLMGLSQGCAASMIAALLWKGEPFGGLVGMCGYLPFRQRMQDCIQGICDGDGGDDDDDDDDDDALVTSGNEEEEEFGDDLFERSSHDGENSTKFEKAVEWLREELTMEGTGDEERGSSALQSIPVFLGHGSDDDKVPRVFGNLADEFLASLDVDVTWKEYRGLGHWYSEDMLRDVVCFLKEKKGGLECL